MSIIWVISKVKFEYGVTFQGIPRHDRRWCYICEVWRCLFSLCMNFILPTILFIQMTLISLKNLSNPANLENCQSWEKPYPILPSCLHITTLSLVSHLLQNRKKKIYLQNPLNKYEFPNNLFSFSSMSLIEFFVLFFNKTTQEKSELRNGKNQNFFFCLVSRSPLFLASKQEKEEKQNELIFPFVFVFIKY